MNIDELRELFNEDEDLKLIAIKDGRVLYKSEDRGIKPMYTLVTEFKEDARDCIIADRVIGRGAAILAREIGIRSLYTELISESAMEILDKSAVEYIYDDKVENILNKKKDGLCPIEKLSQGIVDADKLIIRIEEFFRSMK